MDSEAIRNEIFTKITDWISSNKNVKFVGMSSNIGVSSDSFANIRLGRTKAKPSHFYQLVAKYPEVSDYFYSLLKELEIKKEGYEVGIGIQTLLDNGYSVKDIFLAIKEDPGFVKEWLKKPEILPDRIHLKFKKAFPNINKPKNIDLEAKVDELNKKMEEQGRRMEEQSRKLDWLIEQQQKNK